MNYQMIDNLKIKLIDVVKEKLAVSKRARVCVGFLFLSGFKELRNEIDNLEKLEILAGSRTNRQTAEAILLEKKYREALQDILENTRYLPQEEREKILNEESEGLKNDLSYIEPTEENIEFLKWFLEKLREKKIEIRIYYREPLHAKLYLFEYKEEHLGKGEVIVGSSNFSISGFQLNTELNVCIPGDENFEKFYQWFENLWQQSREGEFSDLAIKAIEESWAFNKNVTPFRIYLRVLHEIFSYKEPEPEIEIETELYRFQKDAVIDAYHRLKKFNGVFIADVPGIGKTYIGSALLSHLETEGKTAIVIVPPRLVEYWQEVLADFGVAKAKVFSSGKLDAILNNEKYLKRKVVLIDESHHFRNPDTQRYKDLSKICEGKEVILLSATPQNLSIWDIYHQLKLFTPYETNHNFRISPISLKKYFEACETGKANIEDLIAQIFIRRTRSDIREYYPDEKIVFPERKGPYRIDYSIDEVYPGGLYDELKKLIKELTYARYNLGNYAIPEKFDLDELQRLSVAWRNLQRLVQINLYRRIESSVAAFRDTIKNHLKIHDGFKRILEKEKKVWVGDLDELEDFIERLENDEEVEWIESKNYYDADKFEVDKLQKDLEKDIEIFRKMKVLTENITPQKDDKLQKLIRILKKPEINGKKIIIFSAFESTVNYIYNNIKDKFDRVDKIAGGEKFLTKIKRFAPKANKAKIKPEEEIKILVATEVLSEGLNLQEGQVVINYELHWNPVRIIQRIGRIDRIGSEHDEIYVYNFFPETAAEKEIKIEDKVNSRINEIIQNFGYDEKTIRLDEPTIRKKLFEIYTERPEGLEEIEEKSGAKYFENEYKRLIKEYPEEYEKAKRLPTMVNIARLSEKKGIIVFCRADDYYRLKLCDESGKIISSDDWEILELLKCKPDEKGMDFNHSYFNIIIKAKEEFKIEANQREQDKLLITDPIKKEFKKLIDWLKRKESNEIKRRFDNLLNFVNQKQLNFEESKFLRSILRSYRKKFGLKKKEILEELEREIYPLLKEAPEVILPKVSPKYAQIIIAEELR
ncbi:MAG: helicase-related protein [candidate division WOR-3 bacterium]